MLIKKGANVDIQNHVSNVQVISSYWIQQAADFFLYFCFQKYVPGLFSFYKEGGFTPLHLACKAGKTETAEVLIKHGANIDMKNMVSKVNQQMLYATSLLYFQVIITAMFISSISCPLRGQYHDTPLHEASREGATKTVEMLILHGANIDVQSKVSAFRITFNNFCLFF